MKTLKFLLIYLILLGLFTTKVKGQYKPVLGDITMWIIDTDYSNSSIFAHRIDSLITQGDTIINGKNYRKVIYYGTDYYVPDTSYLLPFIGFIREDTLTGKVYYFTNWDTTERLIMDMSLMQGDSFFVDIAYPPTGGDTVGLNYTGYVPVDTTWLYNNRKIIVLDLFHPSIVNLFIALSIPPDEWDSKVIPDMLQGNRYYQKLTFIEGVGTSWGIDYMQHHPGYRDKLLCHYNDMDLQFEQGAAPGLCRPGFLIGSNISRPNTAFRFSPNPAREFFQWESNIPISELTLYDLTGRKMQVWKNPPSRIYLQGTSKGLYLLKARFINGGETIVKLLKE